MVSSCSSWLILLLLSWVVSAWDASVSDGVNRYLIGSFPELRQIYYLHLPDTVWRPLVMTDLFNPQAIAVDQDNFRLFVADPLAMKIFWYQMQVASDGSTLITDGLQHTAVLAASPSGLAVDPVGNLWFSGYKMPVGMTSIAAGSTPAVFKQDTVALATTASGLPPIDPVKVWEQGNTGDPKKLEDPAALALDAFNVFWSNAHSGATSGAVVKASISPPGVQPENAVHGLANNIDSVSALALTPTSAFYAAPGGIYGVLKNKGQMQCETDGSDCPLISNLVQEPSAMLWDGESTVYVADSAAGKVFSFPSGTLSEHLLTEVNPAANIQGLALLKYDPSAYSSARPAAMISCGLVAVLLLALFN